MEVLMTITTIPSKTEIQNGSYTVKPEGEPFCHSFLYKGKFFEVKNRSHLKVYDVDDVELYNAETTLYVKNKKDFVRSIQKYLYELSIK